MKIVAKQYRGGFWKGFWCASAGGQGFVSSTKAKAIAFARRTVDAAREHGSQRRHICKKCKRSVIVLPSGRLRSHGFDSLRRFNSRCEESGEVVDGT